MARNHALRSHPIKTLSKSCLWASQSSRDTRLCSCNEKSLRTWREKSRLKQRDAMHWNRGGGNVRGRWSSKDAKEPKRQAILGGEIRGTREGQRNLSRRYHCNRPCYWQSLLGVSCTDSNTERTLRLFLTAFFLVYPNSKPKNSHSSYDPFTKKL